ncbi:hypothetical protein BDM02DRAFT_3189550 [Thelephora ganbajun]|uniref:Uncharacterized protein n=1 Tax=Thelephora ganbajun TaxID=370292 RepID=A0ACB6Z7I3_THEGA|nr:hypothetical protein BDM02DRAFT_3189550 [Thelephora ganbajun]
MSDKTDSKTSSQEQQFSILPHPAKSNDPRDPEPTKPGAGLNKPGFEAFKTPGPVIPNREALVNAGPPATSEELAARTAELNK